VRHTHEDGAADSQFHSAERNLCGTGPDAGGDAAYEDVQRGRETCWICGKPKGQPPERCPGHYLMPRDFETQKLKEENDER
jgi:hypothetical protein